MKPLTLNLTNLCRPSLAFFAHILPKTLQNLFYSVPNIPNKPKKPQKK